MNPTEITFAARDLGILLSTTKEDRISYKPKARMPGWLLEEIKANKEPLLRDPHEDRINELFDCGTLEECREAIRAYVRAGLGAFRRAGKLGEVSGEKTA